MIIITGMDNAGKTTLAEALSKELDLPIIKSPGEVSENAQKEWVLNQLGSEEEMTDAIYDRFAVIEEMIYGAVLRDKPNFSINDPYFNLLKKAKPLVIYARPDNYLIFDFNSREQKEGVIEQAEELLAKFDELIFKMIASGWKVLIYNYRINTVEEIVLSYEISNLLGDLKI